MPLLTLDRVSLAFGHLPLLDDVSIAGATSALVNVTGPKTLTMYEVNEATMLIQEELHEDANVIWGLVIDESLGEEVRVASLAPATSDAAPSPAFSRSEAEYAAAVVEARDCAPGELKAAQGAAVEVVADHLGHIRVGRARAALVGHRHHRDRQ